MKTIAALLFLSVLSACHPKVSKEDVSKINGYWEIEKVILADGIEKDYKINTMYDYIQITNNTGFRKKVTPQFNGKFLVDNLSEEVEVVFESDKVYLKYKTSYAKWKEELKSISDKEMVLVNEEKNEYHYKKTETLNLTNGK